MGGKSRGSGRVKRKQIQSDDGWTVITHGLSNMSLNSSEKSEKQGSLPEIVKGLTKEKLLEEFKMLQERWEDTALAAQIKQIVEGKKSKDNDDGGNGWGVTEGVCIGIGSFSRDWAHRWRSLWQLVLFVDVVQHLKKQNPNISIPCYAQDPVFTPLDTDFLSLLSVTTLPLHLESKITASSFVYSPFVDWFLLLPTFLAGKNPVLYVGNEILDDYGMYAQTSEKRERLEECNEVGRRWGEGREMVRLVEFEKHGNALNGMVVYWRVGGAEEEGRKEIGEDREKEEEKKSVDETEKKDEEIESDEKKDREETMKAEEGEKTAV